MARVDYWSSTQIIWNKIATACKGCIGNNNEKLVRIVLRK